MKNLVDLSGRNVVVTGAGQGIGLEAAALIDSLGADLTLIEVKTTTASELKDRFPRALVLEGSVTDRAFVDAAVNQSVARFGAIHGLLNNAGIVRTAMIEKMTQEHWQQVIDVNLTGVFNCLQAVGTHMVQRRKGADLSPAAIVNIASDAGRKGSVGQINYAAAKSGVLGLTMSAAKEWGRHGIRVNSVCFGLVETEMTEVVRSEKFRDRALANIPLGRFVKPEEVVPPVVFLLSEAASFITGQHLSVNGGSHIGF